MRDRRPIYHRQVIIVGMDLPRLHQEGTGAAVALYGAEPRSLRRGGLDLLWGGGERRRKLVGCSSAFLNSSTNLR